MVTMIVGIMVVAGALVVRIAGDGGASMTEIAVEPTYAVLSVDHGSGDRLVVVLEDRESGAQVVRVYRTKGASETYRIIEE